MPETVAAPTTASTSTAAPVTGGGGASEDVRITYGSPEGDSNVGEVEEKTDGDLQTDGGEGEGSSEGDEFGELDAFGEDEEGEAGIQPEKFSSEQYKALKAALAANPELFKAVKREISENSRYKALYESPEAAREAHERIESLGGLDAIEAEFQEWSKVFEMFKAGDKGVIDYWAKDNPQALAKLFPHVYDQVAEIDPGMWNHKAAGTFIATAQQMGMITALNVLSSMEAVKKSPEIKAQIDSIVEGLSKLNEIATKAPSRDLTPEAKALDERAQKLKDQERQLYVGSLQQKIAPLINKFGTNSLNHFLQGKKLTTEARKGLLEDVNREYARLTAKDEQFQKNRKALLEAGETDKLIKLVSAQLQRTMPMAAKRAWRKYTGISGLGANEAAQRRAEGQSRRESGGGGTPLSVLKTKAPSAGEVDWQRLRAEFGRDGADEVFSFGKKGVNGGIRFYYKKGDSKNIFTF